MTRYARQIILPEIGDAGQAKISAASVLCVGAGGLGCPALLYLASAGIGHIHIIDHDTVDLSNLQRQTLYATDQIGANKAIAAKARLSALNPEIKITAHPEKLTADNAEALFKNVDIIIDGTDNFTTKFLINDAALITEKPFIYASILGFNGQLSTFNYQGGPCYRCLFPAPPTHGVKNCAEAGIIGAVAGIIGSSQALEAIKIITNLDTLKGQILTIDTKRFDQKIISLPKDPDCICANPKDITMHNFEITIDEAKKREAIFINVREQDEWDAGQIEGAKLATLSSLMNGAKLDQNKEAEIILYCKSGYRSMQALHLLRAQGFTNLKNLIGGYDAWEKTA